MQLNENRGVPKWSMLANGPVVGSVSSSGRNADRILQLPSKLTAATTQPLGSKAALTMLLSNFALIGLLVQFTP